MASEDAKERPQDLPDEAPSGGTGDDAGSADGAAVVAVVGSLAEAAALVAKLEEAGIPAAMEPEATYSLGVVMSGQRVLVPAPRAEAAIEVLASAQGEAEIRGVMQAFDAKEDAEPEGEGSMLAWAREGFDRKSLVAAEDETTMVEMRAIAELPPDERRERLTQWVADWLAQDCSPQDMARYLAAAGLTYEEAEQLVRLVCISRREDFDAARRSHMIVGLALAGLGLLCLAGYTLGSIGVTPVGRLARWPSRLCYVGVVLMACGLGMFALARRSAPRGSLLRKP